MTTQPHHPCLHLPTHCPSPANFTQHFLWFFFLCLIQTVFRTVMIFALDCRTNKRPNPSCLHSQTSLEHTECLYSPAVDNDNPTLLHAAHVASTPFAPITCVAVVNRCKLISALVQFAGGVNQPTRCFAATAVSSLMLSRS